MKREQCAINGLIQKIYFLMFFWRGIGKSVCRFFFVGLGGGGNPGSQGLGDLQVLGERHVLGEAPDPDCHQNRWTMV